MDSHRMATAPYALPTGTVTFLLSDVEGSTRLWERAGEAMAVAVGRHYEILDAAIGRHGGVRPVEQGEGDSVVGVFPAAGDALVAALEAQRALRAEDWPDGVALRVRMALHTGAAQLRDQGNYFGVAVSRCARLRALAHGGQVLLSRATCDLVQDGLPEGVELVDLGVHRLRDLDRAEHIFALSHPDLPAVVEPLRSLGALAHNLPVELSSFVGRERELGELRKALAATRLLTLTGPGGCGKTRLALRAASEVAGRFPGGVWWVDLAPLAGERLVGAALAEALGVRPLPGLTELQAACAYLSSRRSLVVLDNCEHLLAACAEATEVLLQAALELVVLATSRAPLGVGGETDWRVPSLSLPALEREGSIEALGGSDAASLFVERARKVRPGFALDDGKVDAVAGICRELDGLPLAIELAAARVRMLSVNQIAAELSDRFRLLTGGPRTASERQQTLRASVDWSHDLLSDDEQVVLRRAAVFAGGFTLDAAEKVCAGDGAERERVLDLLGSLVDQSLVIAEERDPSVRYRLLETVRQYGLERLVDAGEQEALRGRQRDYFLALAEDAGRHLLTGCHRDWLEALDPEAANLAAAIEHALRSEPAVALRLCAALYRWWWARGRVAEAELAYSRSLEACADREPALRARVLHARAAIAIAAGDVEAVEVHASEALTLAEQVADRATAARARCQLGTARLYANPRGGRPELARAAKLARAAGDDWALVQASQMTATSYVLQSDHARAARANDEVAALAKRIGDPLQVARRWHLVAVMAWDDGRFAEARDALARMQAAAQSEEAMDAAFAAAGLAIVDVLQGEPERALERLEGRLERALKLGAGMVVPTLLLATALAEVAATRLEQGRDRLEGLLSLIEGRDDRTASWTLSLLAEAQRMLEEDAAESTALRAQASGERLGNRLLATRGRYTLGRLAAARGDWTVARQHALAHLDACAEGGHATYVPSCLDTLAEAAAGLHAYKEAVLLFAAAERARNQIGAVRVPPEAEHWAAIDSRLREALGEEAYQTGHAAGAGLSMEDSLEWARRGRGPRVRPPGGWASLTPTEAKLVEHIAEGLTNREIGERMFISRETVKTHLSHVFRKLDVHSRTELAARVSRRGTTS
jgi:predicted ATPase/class 3 adenylate cyclase/DNA-binding CsgD family transcriptional regulator